MLWWIAGILWFGVDCFAAGFASADDNVDAGNLAELAVLILLIIVAPITILVSIIGALWQNLEMTQKLNNIRFIKKWKDHREMNENEDEWNMERMGLKDRR